MNNIDANSVFDGNSNKPSPLVRGDVVEIIAPASGVFAEEYTSCLKFLENIGLKVKARPWDSLIRSEEKFCANSIEYRFGHLQEALNSTDSKAIWCLSGGYGSYQLLNLLDKAPAPKVPKLFIGSSDLTVLLNYFVNKWNWNCIYGPMLAQIVRGQVSDKAIEQVRNIIFGKVPSVTLELEPLNEKAKINGEVVGKLVGGCLSLMQTFIGTPQNIDTKGKVLLLEDDRFETPGRVSRIFDHMLRAKVFDGVSAVILGGLAEEDENGDEAGMTKAFEPLRIELDKKNIPLLRNNNIGHCNDMVSVTLGGFTEVKLGESPKLNLIMEF